MHQLMLSTMLVMITLVLANVTTRADAQESVEIFLTVELLPEAKPMPAAQQVFTSNCVAQGAREHFADCVDQGRRYTWQQRDRLVILTISAI